LNPRVAVGAVESRLGAAGVEDPRIDAEILVAHVAGISRSEVAVSEAEIDPAALEALVARRVNREPLQYVLGEWGFRRLTLKVDARALIPRPETETTVERCLALIADLDEPRVVDIGTGTGAIALALVDEHPGARVVATDVSADALALAKENSERTGLAIELVQGDLLAGLEGPFDLVVSNPPYVLSDEPLAPEIADWEPHLAIFGSFDERIADAARGVLRPGGALVVEVAQERAGDAAITFAELGYEDVAITRDLNGAQRVVEGRLAP
jgi:release factor glutamine methyltransferase